MSDVAEIGVFMLWLFCGGVAAGLSGMPEAPSNAITFSIASAIAEPFAMGIAIGARFRRD